MRWNLVMYSVDDPTGQVRGIPSPDEMGFTGASWIFFRSCF